MNAYINLLDCAEMIVAESRKDAQLDAYIVPGWMMRDLECAVLAFAPRLDQGPERKGGPWDHMREQYKKSV